jgi:hypothetical protein
VKCYACGKTGHMSWECSRRRKKEVEKLTFLKRKRGMWNDEESSQKKKQEKLFKETVCSKLLARPDMLNLELLLSSFQFTR